MKAPPPAVGGRGLDWIGLDKGCPRKEVCIWVWVSHHGHHPCFADFKREPREAVSRQAQESQGLGSSRQSQLDHAPRPIGPPSRGPGHRECEFCVISCRGANDVPNNDSLKKCCLSVLDFPQGLISKFETNPRVSAGSH